MITDDVDEKPDAPTLLLPQSYVAYLMKRKHKKSEGGSRNKRRPWIWREQKQEKTLDMEGAETRKASSVGKTEKGS